MIRNAQVTDMPAVLQIHNHAIATSTALWTDTQVDLAERELWFNERTAAGYPIIVAVDENDEVLGYASYGQWRAKEGYRQSVEHSVYVRDGQQGKGLGKSLLQALIEIARQRDVHVMVAGIEAENLASIALHQKFGFQHVGTFTEVGQKFGRWLDISFLQLILDDRKTPQA